VFDALKPQPQDKILQLIQMFRDDPRPDKIDLGVGVYRDATGLTPVMRAVKTAERQLWDRETSKTYTGLAGDPAFHAALSGVILGGSVPQDRIAAVATPGGTGAIRQALELIRLASPAARVWPGTGISTSGRAGSILRGCWRTWGRLRQAMSCCCTAVATTRPGQTRTLRNGRPLPTFWRRRVPCR
jgi:hypothetical protein